MIDAATVAVVAICMTLVSFFTQAKPTDTTPGEKVEAVQCANCPAEGQATAPAAMAPAEAPAPAATAMATPATAPAAADVTPIAPMAQVIDTPAPVQVAAAEPAKTEGKKPSKAAKGKPAAPAAATAEASSAPGADAAAPGFHINVGLFAVPTNAHNAYQKLVGAGFAAYTQEITSKTKGKLTRVRVGPFASRAEADAAADKIHGLQLEAVVFQR